MKEKFVSEGTFMRVISIRNRQVGSLGVQIWMKNVKLAHWDLILIKNWSKFLTGSSILVEI